LSAIQAFGHSFPVSRVSAFLRARPDRPSRRSAAKGLPIIKNLYRLPQQSTRLLFIDDHGENWDAMWYIHYAQPKWWNPVPMRHGAGTVAAFADTHSEFHAWKDPRTIEYAKMTWAQSEAQRASAPAQNGNEDLRWVQTAVWGKLGYAFEPGP